MARKTTVKPIALHYRPVGTNVTYTPLMGILKGLAVGQDEPDSTEIEAEFYDAPFDIFYDGNPVTMTFELTNYGLDELPNLFGGTYDELDSLDYEAEPVTYTSEWEWRLDFGRGYAALIIVRGLTIGTIKKETDGALNFSVTVTSLVYNVGGVESMYKIKVNNYHYAVVPQSVLDQYDYSPRGHGLYELDGEGQNARYVLTQDSTPEQGKTYYQRRSDFIADSIDSSDSSDSSDSPSSS